MQYASVLLDALLALACAACVLAIGGARRRYGEADQPALFCALLGFLLAAAAAAVGALSHAIEPGWQAAQLWLSQASSFLGLPLLGMAALALGRGWACSRPTWGRLLMGLCAFFELFRQMNLLDDYRQLLNLASAALILYAGAVQWPRRGPALAAAAAVGLALLSGLAIGRGGWNAPLHRGEPGGLLLIAAYPLLAWLLLALPGGGRVGAARENPAKTL